MGSPVTLAPEVLQAMMDELSHPGPLRYSWNNGTIMARTGSPVTLIPEVLHAGMDELSHPGPLRYSTNNGTT